jgi:cation transport regulator ChaC
MSSWYFAYGSNMNPARVTERGLAYDRVQGGVLRGVRLTFDKQSRDHLGSGHANLTIDSSAYAEGVLYRLRNASDIALMDRFEHTPVNYNREIVEVISDGAVVAAWTYFANAAVIRPNLRPERAYLAHLLAGRDYLSDAYYTWLSSIECADD